MADNTPQTPKSSPSMEINPFTGKPMQANLLPEPFGATVYPFTGRSVSSKTFSLNPYSPPSQTPLASDEAKTTNLGIRKFKKAHKTGIPSNALETGPAPQMTAFESLETAPRLGGSNFAKVKSSRPPQQLFPAGSGIQTPTQDTAVVSRQIAVPTITTQSSLVEGLKFTRRAIDLARSVSPAIITEQYAKVFGDLDTPFVQYLKRIHGIAPTDKSSIITNNGTPLFHAYSTTRNHKPQKAIKASEDDDLELPFKNNWDSAIAYRYRATRPPDINPIKDDTIIQVIMQAEDWILQLVKAMINLENIKDKPKSNEVRLFSESPDLKEIEATCRHILTALIHRCIVGFCGNERRNKSKPVDRSLTCMARLLHVVNGLRQDKRICRDVLLEDSKITIFVHQPLTYLKRKGLQEQANNRKAVVYRLGKLDGQGSTAASTQSPGVDSSGSRSPTYYETRSSEAEDSEDSILAGMKPSRISTTAACDESHDNYSEEPSSTPVLNAMSQAESNDNTDHPLNSKKRKLD